MGYFVHTLCNLLTDTDIGLKNSAIWRHGDASTDMSMCLCNSCRLTVWCCSSSRDDLQFQRDGGCCTVIVVQRQTGQICENLKGRKCVRSKDVENQKQ